jgi:acetyltransferase-like isoleucine patch superfamily enzyme
MVNMLKEPAQHIIHDDKGRMFIEHDWHPDPLPQNVQLDEMSYLDTSYSFTTFFSKRNAGFKLGYASGNYGHSIFTTGERGEVNVGKFVVLQGTRIVSNLSVTIKDHTMVSWGSVITDSWFKEDVLSIEERRSMLEKTSNSFNRHLEFSAPKPIVIEENAWIGFGAIILPGVTIGRGAVVGSKTVVSTDVPPYAVVVGSPSRIIRYLDANDADEIKEKAIKDFIK